MVGPGRPQGERPSHTTKHGGKRCTHMGGAFPLRAPWFWGLNIAVEWDYFQEA